MSRRKLLAASVVVGLIVMGVLVLLSWIYLKGPASIPRVPPPLVPSDSSDRRLLLRGFSTVKYTDDGQEAFRLKIGKAETRSNTGGFWNSRLTRVAEMTGVQIDLFNPQRTGTGGNQQPGNVNRQQPKGVSSRQPGNVGTNPAAGDPSEAIKFLMDMRKTSGWEAVSDFDIRDVTINLHEDKTLVTGIKAQKLSLGSKGQLVLEGDVSITSEGNRRRLTGDRVIWWFKLGLLAVKERYSLNDAGQTRQGTRTIFKLHLEPITNKAEISEYEKRAQHKGLQNHKR